MDGSFTATVRPVSYTHLLQGSRDIHEDALDLQRRVREVYLAAADMCIRDREPAMR